MKLFLILITLTSSFILSGCAPTEPIPEMKKSDKKVSCQKVVKKSLSVKCPKKTKIVYYEDVCGDDCVFPVTMRETSLKCSNGGI